MQNKPMKVVIFGAGLVGEAVGRHIAEQGHHLCFIESNLNTVRKIREQMDVQIVHGSAEDQDTLREARVREADLILAITNQDKSNIILTLIARSLNPTARIVTRVKDDAFLNNHQLWQSRDLNDTLIISPERAVIEKAINILDVQHAFDLVEFLDNKIRVACFRLGSDNVLAGKPLQAARAELPSKQILIVGVERGDEVFIPSGDTVLETGDRICITLPEGIELPVILPLLGKSHRSRQKFVIAGGSPIGVNIARQLEQRGRQVVVIESDYERCQMLTEMLSKSVILHGEVTDTALLGRAITPETTLLATTSVQEVNFFIALWARKRGAMQVISMMDNEAYFSLAPELGVDAILSPRAAAVGSILRFIRMGRVLDSDILLGGKLNLFLTEIQAGSRLDGPMLKEASLPEGVIVAASVRNDRIEVPHGNLRLQQGDQALFVVQPGKAPLLDRWIARNTRWPTLF
ncbi:Trk system potassium uptake protein TrkA [Candidatus Magnetaquicoccaceae bacterium FCR-1]|uniref:Trk system potassium uptake protein TrkA n=1 Tax=Candidatus Magnetaquiglobus chichijimensis TaxID=3141448 RepID=A0ABQ0C7X0_9PROT